MKHIVKVAKTGTLFSSTINLTNTIIGSGVLGLPYAIAQSGLVTGLLLLMGSALAAAFGLYLLVQCSNILSRRSNENPSYYSCAQATYPSASALIDFVVFIKCFGVATSYLNVIGDYMPDVIGAILGLAPEDPLPENLYATSRFWIIISAFLIVPLCFLKQLHSLRFTSGLSLITVGYLLALVVTYFFMEGIPIKDDIGIAPFNGATFLEVMTIFVFGFTCHQNVFSIYNELIDPTPKRINFVIFASIGSAFGVYLIIALLGYLTYGIAVDSNIINNCKFNLI